MLYTEKKAGEFLEKNGFKIKERIFVTKKEQLKKIPFPYVMKVSGSTIVHKSRLGGVFVGIKSLSEAESDFDKIMKISGAEEVLVQGIVSGRLFILGVKKTPEFGHVLIFGNGGTDVEKKKDVSFRVAPIKKFDARDMIHDTIIGKTVTKEEEKFLVKNLLKLSKLVKKYPSILELDINPIIDGEVVDPRIVLE